MVSPVSNTQNKTPSLNTTTRNISLALLAIGTIGLFFTVARAPLGIRVAAGAGGALDYLIALFITTTGKPSRNPATPPTATRPTAGVPTPLRTPSSPAAAPTEMSPAPTPRRASSDLDQEGAQFRKGGHFYITRKDADGNLFHEALAERIEGLPFFDTDRSGITYKMNGVIYSTSGSQPRLHIPSQMPGAPIRVVGLPVVTPRTPDVEEQPTLTPPPATPAPRSSVETQATVVAPIPLLQADEVENVRIEALLALEDEESEIDFTYHISGLGNYRPPMTLAQQEALKIYIATQSESAPTFTDPALTREVEELRAFYESNKAEIDALKENYQTGSAPVPVLPTRAQKIAYTIAMIQKHIDESGTESPLPLTPALSSSSEEVYESPFSSVVATPTPPPAIADAPASPLEPLSRVTKDQVLEVLEAARGVDVNKVIDMEAHVRGFTQEQRNMFFLYIALSSKNSPLYTDTKKTGQASQLRSFFTYGFNRATIRDMKNHFLKTPLRAPKAPVDDYIAIAYTLALIEHHAGKRMTYISNRTL